MYVWRTTTERTEECISDMNLALGIVMKPWMLTDGELNREIETAEGDRLAALKRERDERRAFRASMRGYDPSLKWPAEQSGK